MKDGHYVFFNELQDWGASIMVYYFVRFTDWRVYLQARQDIFLDILRRLDEGGIKLGLPTQRIELDAAGPPIARDANPN